MMVAAAFTFFLACAGPVPTARTQRKVMQSRRVFMGGAGLRCIAFYPSHVSLPPKIPSRFCRPHRLRWGSGPQRILLFGHASLGHIPHPPMKQTLLLCLLIVSSIPVFAEDWPQFQFNARHSGNAADRTIAADKLGLQRAVALSDGIYTSPVVADGRVYVVDG